VGGTGLTHFAHTYGGVFCPCINKALLKSSWTLSNGNLADIASSAYWSRMLQFVGKQDWIAGYFRFLSDSWKGDVSIDLMDAYAGTDDSESSCPLPTWAQRKLLMLSTGEQDARHFTVYQHNHRHFDKAGDIIYDFPIGFQNAIRALSNCEGATQIQDGKRIRKES